MKSIEDIIEIDEAKEKPSTDILVVLGIGERNTWPAQHGRIFKVKASKTLLNILTKKQKSTFFHEPNPGNHKPLTSKERDLEDSLVNTMKSHLGYQWKDNSCMILAWCLATNEGGKSDWASGPTSIDDVF